MTKNDEVRSFARRRACRAPAGKVLIVTEGENRSAGDCVERALKRHWPGYKKSDPTAWRALRDRLPEAMKRARRARADAVATGELNPSTEADLLVEALQKLVA